MLASLCLCGWCLLFIQQALLLPALPLIPTFPLTEEIKKLEVKKKKEKSTRK